MASSLRRPILKHNSGRALHNERCGDVKRRFSAPFARPASCFGKYSVRLKFLLIRSKFL